MLGTDNGKRVVEKLAGNYYIYYNSSGIESYTVTVEAKETSSADQVEATKE